LGLQIEFNPHTRLSMDNRIPHEVTVGDLADGKLATILPVLETWKSLHKTKFVLSQDGKFIETLTKPDGANGTVWQIDFTADKYTSIGIGIHHRDQKIIRNCIDWIQTTTGVDFLAEGASPMHFVYFSHPESDQAVLVERRDDQIFTTEITLYDGRVVADEMANHQLLIEVINNYVQARLTGSQDLTPNTDTAELVHKEKLSATLDQTLSRWQERQPSPRKTIKQLTYTRNGYGQPLTITQVMDSRLNDISSDNWMVKTSVSTDVMAMEFRRPFDNQTIKQILEAQWAQTSDTEINLLLTSPDIPYCLLLISGAREADGAVIYTSSELYVSKDVTLDKSSATRKSEAAEIAKQIMENYLSVDIAEAGPNPERQATEVDPVYAAEASLNQERDQILNHWTGVLGVGKISQQSTNGTFIQMSISMDDLGRATILTDNFTRDASTGFFTPDLQLINAPTDAAFLNKHQANNTLCLFDINSEPKHVKFKGEIIPIERCNKPEIEIILKSGDKLNQLLSGETFYLVGESPNEALFIENRNNKLFVTKIEIQPSDNVAKNAGQFSVTFDYNFIFDSLLEHYQNNTVIT